MVCQMLLSFVIVSVSVALPKIEGFSRTRSNIELSHEVEARFPQGSSQAFVHLFEWSWNDVALECEAWLGPKGFTAVQVSPPTEHILGSQWWTRYQPVTYNLTSRSGDERAFIDMVRRCARVGVGIYVDTVINHCAAGAGTGVAGSIFGNRTFPLYQPEHFHHHDSDLYSNCVVHKYQDRHVIQFCDFLGLTDLCTGCKQTQEVIAAYIKHLAAIGVAGLRFDAAFAIDPDELAAILDLANETIFVFQEVTRHMEPAVTAGMYLTNGMVTEMKYGADLGMVFQSGELQRLSTFGESWGLIPGKNAVVFLDNHDSQRNDAPLTYKDGQVYKLANIYMLAHPYGYPKVMSSYAFSSNDEGPPTESAHSQELTSWVREHRWPAVANMVAWRRVAGDSPVRNFVAPTSDTVAFCRGNLACVALNRGTSVWTVHLTASLPSGKYCNIIKSHGPNCPVVAVSAFHLTNLSVPPLGAIAFHVGSRINHEQWGSDLMLHYV